MRPCVKVADFGLASIVDNTKDKIYNVGTPMYKSPGLLQAGYNYSEYDITNIMALKSCDVFSLSIFWQMMNGIEYLPFKCYKNNGINGGNCGLIKTRQFGKFWDVHKKCNMVLHSKDDILLLSYNLFEQMFEYNHQKRITIESILKHQFIVSNENNPLFHVNNTTLEAFVRDQYHQTKNAKRNTHQHQHIIITAVSQTTKTTTMVMIIILQVMIKQGVFLASWRFISSSNITKCIKNSCGKY